jgi:hypothetical protein
MSYTADIPNYGHHGHDFLNATIYEPKEHILSEK